MEDDWNKRRVVARSAAKNRDLTNSEYRRPHKQERTHSDSHSYKRTRPNYHSTPQGTNQQARDFVAKRTLDTEKPQSPSLSGWREITQCLLRGRTPLPLLGVEVETIKVELREAMRCYCVAG
ncbi:unnamed protein product [Arabis nemorensis]|uniref:Uncharacterized protein n=1 Tax=Arabis nemorensis TaxID=586526 RepID=A0A565CTN9_9BRAS|nr:unnamed protein product [Arabis nemorensis]